MSKTTASSEIEALALHLTNRMRATVGLSAVDDFRLFGAKDQEHWLYIATVAYSHIQRYREELEGEPQPEQPEPTYLVPKTKYEQAQQDIETLKVLLVRTASLGRIPDLTPIPKPAVGDVWRIIRGPRERPEHSHRLVRRLWIGKHGSEWWETEQGNLLVDISCQRISEGNLAVDALCKTVEEKS